MAVSSSASIFSAPFIRGQNDWQPEDLTPSSEPFFMKEVAGLYSRQRRRPPPLLWQYAQLQKQEILGSFEQAKLSRFLNTFKDSAVVFVPGLLNFFPGDDFFKTLSSVFGHGGLIIGVAAKYGATSHHGVYSVVGSNNLVIQPDWRTEMVILIRRLIMAFNDPQVPASRAQKLVFVGHSKGGMLVHGLQALALFASTPQSDKNLLKVKKLFPGLDSIPLKDFHLLLDRLQNAQFFLYGAPVEGIERKGIVSVVDRFFLQRSAKYFTPEFMAKFFDELDHPLAQAEAIIHARKDSQLRDVLKTDSPLPSFIGNAVTTVARLLFHGGGYLIDAHQGDGLIQEPFSLLDDPRLQILATNSDHLQMVETRKAAKALLEILDDHVSNRNHNLTPEYLTILKAAQEIALGLPVNPYLSWVLTHNPAKVFETSSIDIPHKSPRTTSDHPPQVRSRALSMLSSLAKARGLPFYYYGSTSPMSSRIPMRMGR